MAVLIKSVFHIISLYLLVDGLQARINVTKLRCLVCEKTVGEIEREIERVGPQKRIEVGGYRLDGQGNVNQAKMEFRRSEVFLTELMETVCDKMDDYVRATHKMTGELMVIPLITPGGQMHPLMNEVDVIQDSDLNRSLKFYCQGILEDHMESYLKIFSSQTPEASTHLCTHAAKLCDPETDDVGDDDTDSRDEL